MPLHMTTEEREAFLAEVHVGIVAVDDPATARWRYRSGTPTNRAARSAS